MARVVMIIEENTTMSEVPLASSVFGGADVFEGAGAALGGETAPHVSPDFDGIFAGWYAST